MNHCRRPWWCVLFQIGTLPFILVACLGFFLFIFSPGMGWSKFEQIVIYGAAMMVAIWAYLELPVQACKANRGPVARFLICAGLLLACWLLPELLMRIAGFEISYFDAVHYYLIYMGRGLLPS